MAPAVRSTVNSAIRTISTHIRRGPWRWQWGPCAGCPRSHPPPPRTAPCRRKEGCHFCRQSQCGWTWLLKQRKHALVSTYASNSVHNVQFLLRCWKSPISWTNTPSQADYRSHGKQPLHPALEQPNPVQISTAYLILYTQWSYPIWWKWR